MKKIKYNWILTLLISFGIVGLLNSCQKNFDPKSYAPLQSFGGYTYSKEIAPNNLVGYWAFDGSLVDSVSNASGTSVGTSFTTGIKGKAMQGANNGYVIFTPGNAIKTLTSFTVSYWINTPQNTNGIVGTVNISRTDDFWGNLDMFYENGSTATSSVFKVHVNNNNNGAWLVNTIPNPWNSWMQVLVSYNAATSKFNTYVNGVSIGSSVQTGYGPITFQNPTAVIFGTVQFQTTPSLGTAGGTQGWASYLTGAMDEVRIYNKALSDLEVHSLWKLESLGR